MKYTTVNAWQIFFNKMIEENFLNLEKGMSSQVQGSIEHQIGIARKENPQDIVNAKTESKEMVLKTARRNG